MRRLISFVSALTLLSACDPGPKNAMINPIDPQDFSFLAAESHPERAGDPIRQQLGQFFLVEHFAVTADNTMLSAIRSHQPGGILFWNQNKVSAEELRSVILRYSSAAKHEGHAPLLFSADYEGGGMNLSPSGASIPGIQRFTNGFTPLAHPAWLGRSMPKYGTELCTLHGAIMAKELSSVGLNYPLSVVSDLAMRLMKVRGISTKPEQISTCMNAIVAAFQKESNMVMVTKHFPGLGQVEGDTHDGVSISKARDLNETKLGMASFQKTIQYVNENGMSPILSIMSSHAKFPLLDDKNLTTESPIILNDILKKQLGFKGIALSDAMWMGDYGKMGTSEVLVAYLNSFLSGMDMLMIPGSKFANAVTFFRSVYDDSPDARMKALVEAKIGPWASVRERFISRVGESLNRIQATQAVLKHAVDSASSNDVVPRNLTREERTRYMQILDDLDPQFRALVGGLN